jgi:membrane associated rhomboid family serine protease
VILLIGMLVLAHLARIGLGIGPDRFALTGQDVATGRWIGLVSHLFVHGSWAHLFMNSVFVLAFGTPVSRFLGGHSRGALAFLAFFIACGVIAALAYAGLDQGLEAVGFGPGRQWAIIGASGAASGLFGAAARLIQGKGRLGALWGPTVVGFAVAWILLNAILGLSGLTPGAAGAPVAWEAHIFGFFAGLVLIGPFARLAGLEPAIAFTKR